MRKTIETLTAERDEARANYQFMVDRACDEKLDGYRKLSAHAAELENEADGLRVKVAKSISELEKKLNYNKMCRDILPDDQQERYDIKIDSDQDSLNILRRVFGVE